MINFNFSYGSTHNKVGLLEFRRRQSRLLHLFINTINTFTEFSHKAIIVQDVCDFRITREMCGTKIPKTYRPRKNARTFNCKVVRKNLHLNIGARYRIIAMSNGIYNKFRPTKFRIIGHGTKNSTFTQKSMFLYLRFHKRQNISCHFNNAAFEHFILHHIHSGSSLLYVTVETYNAHPRPLKPPLWLFAKNKQSCTANKFLVMLFYNESLVCAKIGLCIVLIANSYTIIGYAVQINIIQ